MAVLAISVLAVIAVMAIGGAVTASSVGDWYHTLTKPTFTPPDWLFGPVWAVLYALMAVAAWLVWRRAGIARARVALALHATQLMLNLGWTLLFFGAHAIGLALVEIVLLLAAIGGTTIAFWRIDRAAAVLLFPYLLWVGYAATLNAAIVALN